MPQSLSKIYLHTIFSTKDRYPFLTPEIRPKLHAYLAPTLANLNAPTLAINSMENHIHILHVQPKSRAPCDIIRELKSNSSQWIKTKSGTLSKFAWQNGYATFSVSQSGIQAVKRYIDNQQQHHQKLSYEDELRALLNRHQLEYNESYLWD